MIKYLEIKTIDDYNKFIKNLKKYKRFTYRKTTFKVKSNPIFKDVNSMSEALNIKNRKKRIEYIYDYCCDYLDDYCKNKDFCKFKNNKCLNQYNNEYENGCCRGCRYQSNNGCKTRNLTCKLFYCNTVKKDNKTLNIKDLKILNILGYKSKIIIKHDFFVKREDMLKDLYNNSIILFTFKTLFRMLYIRKEAKKKISN